MRVNLTKSANKNLLAASTLAEDILEHIREASIEDYPKLANALIVDDDTKVFGPGHSDSFISLLSLIYEDETLPAALDTLPEAENLSSVTFINNKSMNNIENIEKLMVTVVIRWKEIARNPGEQMREYHLATYITESGLGERIKQWQQGEPEE